MKVELAALSRAAEILAEHPDLFPLDAEATRARVRDRDRAAGGTARGGERISANRVFQSSDAVLT
ncbi:MAG: hypothetical protein O2992_14330 [Gemmatimonadetes bacterium]|nr:hypothetical protein [Gemmatimonadota bacterium]